MAASSGEGVSTSLEDRNDLRAAIDRLVKQVRFVHGLATLVSCCAASRVTLNHQ